MQQEKKKKIAQKIGINASEQPTLKVAIKHIKLNL